MRLKNTRRNRLGVQQELHGARRILQPDGRGLQLHLRADFVHELLHKQLVIRRGRHKSVVRPLRELQNFIHEFADAGQSCRPMRDFASRRDSAVLFSIPAISAV